jgi:16S rRNA (cytosine1402-N4)-methyltransferase
LVSTIEGAVPAGYRRRRIHCATKTFQALRIEVNRELEAILAGIDAALKTLQRGGRLMVISFHGGEDKLVRERFKEAVKAGEASWVIRRTIRPSWDEVQQNSRSRSAKLKIIEIA